MRKHGNIIILLICLSGYNTVFSQLTFDNTLTPLQLAQMLAGPGVTVSNATMNCPLNATGSFSGSSDINPNYAIKIKNFLETIATSFKSWLTGLTKMVALAKKSLG